MGTIRNFKIIGTLLGLFLVLGGYQNCSSATNAFTANPSVVDSPFADPPVVATGENQEADAITEVVLESDPLIIDPLPNNGVNGSGISLVICDPLSGGAEGCPMVADVTAIELGLLGKIYYLTQADHEDFIQDKNLNNAKLNDYYTYGTQVEADIYLTDVNVSPRAFDVGFKLPDGSNVKDSAGNDLLEYFAIKLDGFLKLPAGEYDLAILSDDGMAISLNGQEVLRDDGTHAPRYKCTSNAVTFADGVSQALHVEYFQGPRFQISMQLLMRPHDANGKCDAQGGWMEIPKEAYSKN